MLGHGALGDYLVAHGPPDGTEYVKSGFGKAGGVGAGPSESVFQKSGFGKVGTVGAGTASPARVSQVAVESLEAGVGAARVSQDAVEVLEAGTGNARVSQDAVEVLRASTGTTTAGVSQVAVEVLGAVGVTYTKSGWGTVGCDGYGNRRFPYEKTGWADVNGDGYGTAVHNRFSTGVGPGNGGEAHCTKLAPNGTSETATLTDFMSSTSNLVAVSGDSGFPTGGFHVEIDDEVLYIVKTGTGTYRAVKRGQSNTVAASHAVGATVTWGDSYDMAVESTVNIAADFFYDFDEITYPGWILTFDAAQAYVGGNHYPMHFTELLGVFPAGDRDVGSRLDGVQPVARHVPEGVSEDCPAAIGIPARIQTDIVVGDVALVRYTNPEASVMTLCDRATALQSWYGFMRVDDDNVDVTFTDPDGNIFDGPGIDDEFFDESFITVTLPGNTRTFTHGGTPSPPNFNDKGWPLAALAVRNNNRRVPHWVSPDWHNFSYVYTGFHADALFVQVLVNRNGILYGPEPSVTLPGSQDIDGPNATWDDPSYRSSTAWGVYLFNGTYLLVGPILNPPPGFVAPPSIVPVVPSPGTPGGDPGDATPADEFLEGGEGGDIDPPPTGEGVHVHTEGIILPFTPTNIQLT